MKFLLTPAPAPVNGVTFLAIVLMLAASAICVFVAALVMPDGYSWRSHVISESAAQGLNRAWVARLGFVLFGFAVLWLSISLRSVWARGAYWCHLVFALFMVSTAVFSHKPWLGEIAYDPLEDLLHSITATGMGFAFSFGVLMRLLQREKSALRNKMFDIVAIGSAVMLPAIGGAEPQVVGLAQRLLFLIAYVWYGNEALSIARATRSN